MPTVPSYALQDFGVPLVLEDFTTVEQPVTANSSPICALCHKTVDILKRCSQCKNIGYCSEVCQKGDWGQHKLVCKTFTFFKKVSNKVDPNKRLAMHFTHDNKAPPFFVWLTYGDDGIPLNIVDRCFPQTPPGEIHTIAFHNRYLPYWIQISYESRLGYAGCPLRDSSMLPGFGGNVVVLAYDAVEGLNKPALNVDTTALGPVVEYAKLRAEYSGPIFVEQPQERYTEEQWKAIAPLEPFHTPSKLFVKSPKRAQA